MSSVILRAAMRAPTNKDFLRQVAHGAKTKSTKVKDKTPPLAPLPFTFADYWKVRQSERFKATAV